METRKQCYGCAYRRQAAGSAHSQCTFGWMEQLKEDIDTPHKVPGADIHGIRSGWYNFPLNYDPVWMNTECTAREENPEKATFKGEPLINYLMIWRGQ